MRLRYFTILHMMIATNGDDLRTIGGGVLAFLLYGLFFWRVFKKNPGNKLVECGCITLTAFLVMIPINSAGAVPDWLFGVWG